MENQSICSDNLSCILGVCYATQLFNDPHSLYIITVGSLSVSSSTQEVLFTTDSKETSQAEIVGRYKHC